MYELCDYCSRAMTEEMKVYKPYKVLFYIYLLLDLGLEWWGRPSHRSVQGAAGKGTRGHGVCFETRLVGRPGSNLTATQVERVRSLATNLSKFGPSRCPQNTVPVFHRYIRRGMGSSFGVTAYVPESGTRPTSGPKGVGVEDSRKRCRDPRHEGRP